ncbi:MAG: glycosyltransferase, partial [Bacilli bacterium]|nr:glycosyltransferase [Bacilli bacterium]
MIKLLITIGCLEVGGAEIFVLNLLKRLDYRKFQVLLIVLSKKHNTFIEDELEKLPIKIQYLNKKEGFRPLTMLRLTLITRRFSPNIMHGNVGGMLYLFLYLLIFWKSKAIHTTHTLANFEYGTVKRKILAMFYRRKKVIPVAISPVIKKSIIETYGLSEDQVILINNAVDVFRFKTYRCYYNKGMVIGHIGRYNPVKNHQTIIAVYRQLLQSYPDLQ